MKLHRNDAMWDRDERKKLNENWDDLEGLSRDFDNAVDKVSEEAFDKVVDSAKLDWATMVDEYSDLPMDAEKGTTIGVEEDGKVYRFDGTNWIDIYPINLNPIAEVDERLSQQLADTEQEVRVIYRTVDEKMIAFDLQAIDVESLKERGEGMPLIDREVVEIELMPYHYHDDVDSGEFSSSINQDILRKFKEFEVWVTNDFDVDVAVYFTAEQARLNFMVHKLDDERDTTYRNYGADASMISHLVKRGARYLKLSDVPAQTNHPDNSNNMRYAVDPVPFKSIYFNSTFDMHCKPMDTPSKGQFKAFIIGVPN